MDEKQILKFMPSVMIQYSFKLKEAKQKDKRLIVELNILESYHPSEYLIFLTNVSKSTHTHIYM